SASRKDFYVPATSTIPTGLDRYGLLSHTLRSRTRLQVTPLSEGLKPQRSLVHRLQARVHARRQAYCYLLTVTDHASTGSANGKLGEMYDADNCGEMPSSIL